MQAQLFSVSIQIFSGLLLFLTTISICSVKVDFVRSVTAGGQLREEDHLSLETVLASVPQSQAVKSNSMDLTPQLSPATTPANRKNRLPLGISAIFYFLLQFSSGRCRLVRTLIRKRIAKLVLANGKTPVIQKTINYTSGDLKKKNKKMSHWTLRIPHQTGQLKIGKTLSGIFLFIFRCAVFNISDQYNVVGSITIISAKCSIITWIHHSFSCFYSF